MINSRIYRVGVELKEGCTVEGADLAIRALRDACISFDEVISVSDQEKPYPWNLLHLPQVVDINQRIKKVVKDAKNKEYFPLTFGGDHSLAIGSISAIAQNNTAVFWVDAHGDCNTDQTTLSGRIHGMPLAVLQGDGVADLTALVDIPLKKENIVLFGIRSLDPKEEIYIQEKGIRMYTMDKIREMGFFNALSEALDYLKGFDVHLSFDLDSIDPRECKGVNTPVYSGFRVKEALQLIARSFEECNITSMDIVEYNPIFDEGNTIQIVKSINRIVTNQKGV